MRHYSLTKDQRQTLDRDLATITESLENIASPLRVCYGDADRLVYQADEASAAVQRLLWAMERQRSGRNKRQLNLIGPGGIDALVPLRTSVHRTAGFPSDRLTNIGFGRRRNQRRQPAPLCGMSFEPEKVKRLHGRRNQKHLGSTRVAGDFHGSNCAWQAARRDICRNAEVRLY